MSLANIQSAIQDILQRAAKPGEAETWFALQTNNQLSFQEIITAIANGLESQQVVQPVVGAYGVVYGRMPDKAGLDFWVDQHRLVASTDNLATPENEGLIKVLRFFVDPALTPEFATRFGVNPDGAAYVAALYANVLGRPADPAGLAFWEGVYAAKLATYTAAGIAKPAVEARAWVLDAFLRSDEFHTLNDEYVINFLEGAGQVPDPAGLYTGILGNDAPVNTSPSAASVAENVAAGTLVATLSGTDIDFDQTLTFTIVSDPSGLFAVDGNKLVVKAGADVNFEAANSHQVTVAVNDGKGGVVNKVITVSVTNVNEAPTAIAPDAASVNENSAINTVVATFATTDPDAGATFTYALNTAGTPFTIVGNQLRVNAPINFEAGPTSYNLSITSTDQGGLSVTETLVVSIGNVNENPTDISLSNTSVNENVGGGTLVAVLSGVDPDAGTVLTFSLSSPSSTFEIVNGNELRVKAGATINFEVQSAYGVGIIATDQGGLTYNENFTITVADLNEAPTDISLSNNVVGEGDPAGTVIGNLTGVDPDTTSPNNNTTFSIVSNPNGWFAIQNGQLVVANGAVITNFPGVADDTVTVTIRVTDGGNPALFYDETFTIAVADLDQQFTSALDDNLIGTAFNDTFRGTASNAGFFFPTNSVHPGDFVDGNGGFDTANITVGTNLFLPLFFSFGSTELENIALDLSAMQSAATITVTDNAGLERVELLGGRFLGDTFTVRDIQNANGLVVNINDNQGMNVHLDWDGTVTPLLNNVVNINLNEAFIPTLTLTNQLFTGVPFNTGIERINLTSGGPGSSFGPVLPIAGFFPTGPAGGTNTVIAGSFNANLISDINSGPGGGAYASSLNAIFISNPASGPVADLVIGGPGPGPGNGYLYTDIPVTSALGAIVDNTGLTTFDSTAFTGRLYVDFLPSAVADWDGTATLGNGQNVAAIGASLADGVGSVTAGTSLTDVAIFNDFNDLPYFAGTVINNFEFAVFTDLVGGQTLNSQAIGSRTGGGLPELVFADGLNGDITIDNIVQTITLNFNNNWDNADGQVGTGIAENNLIFDFDNGTSNLNIVFAPGVNQSADLVFYDNDISPFGPAQIQLTGDGSNNAVDIEGTFGNTTTLVINGTSFFDVDATGGDVAANITAPAGTTSINRVDARNNSGGVNLQGFFLASAAGQGFNGQAGGTELGGSGNDVLVGSNPTLGATPPAGGAGGNDFLQGNGGNDTIFGLAGNDFIEGNAGNDTIDGGLGDDTIWGDNPDGTGSGNDIIFGGQGSDLINAGAGNDIVWGNDGTLPLESNNATPDGNDTINLGSGNDRANGANGNDTIRGEDGNDRMAGNGGNDLLIGGLGGDQMEGGGNAVFGGGGRNEAGYAQRVGGWDDILDARGNEANGNVTVDGDALVGDGFLGNGALITAATPGTPEVFRIDISGFVEITDSWQVVITHPAGVTTITVTQNPNPLPTWTDTDVRNALVDAINDAVAGVNSPLADATYTITGTSLVGSGVSAANGPQPSDLDITGPTPQNATPLNFNVTASFQDDFNGVNGVQQIISITPTQTFNGDVGDSFTVNWELGGVVQVAQVLTLTAPDTDNGFFVDGDYDNSDQYGALFAAAWNANAALAAVSTASYTNGSGGVVTVTSDVGGTANAVTVAGGIVEASDATADGSIVFSYAALDPGDQPQLIIDPDTTASFDEVSFVGNSLQDVANQFNASALAGNTTTGMRAVVDDAGNRLAIYDYDNDTINGPNFSASSSIIGGNGGTVTQVFSPAFAASAGNPTVNNAVQAAVNDPDVGPGVVSIAQIQPGSVGTNDIFAPVLQRGADLFVIGNDGANLANPGELDSVLDFNGNPFGWGFNNGDAVNSVLAQGNAPATAILSGEGDKISFGDGAPAFGQYFEAHNLANNYADAYSTALAIASGNTGIRVIALSYDGGVADDGDTIIDPNEDFLLVFHANGSGGIDAGARLVGYNDVLTQFGITDIV